MMLLGRERPFRFAALVVGALALGAAAPPPSQLPNALRSHVTFLADDLMEGRGLGTRGHEIAARYVAAQFAAMGLKPAGTDGYLQRITFLETRFTSDHETLTLDRAGTKAVFTNGVEMTLSPGSIEGAEMISAPIVFAGYGLKDARLGIDDYAGVDAAGKIVVVLTGAPAAIDGEIGAHLSRSKGGFALAAGAIGLIQVRTLADAARAPWSKSVARARQPRRSAVSPDGQLGGDGAGLKVRASVDEATAAALFAGAPMGFAAVQAAAANGPVKGFALSGTVTIQRANGVSRVTSPNVLGLLPGSSHGLTDQIVVISAHLDHLGMRPDLKGDQIFNGALDNASGVATLIETARALAGAKTGPKRSILFMATTGEESGLLGSDYFARHPTVALDRVVADVNIDMPLLTCDFGDVIAYGAERSTVANAVRAAAQDEGLGLSPDPQPVEAIFVRSDQYPFIKAGVPAVFLKTGWRDAHGGQACAAADRDFRLNHYHEPSDDLSLPLDWTVAAKFARLNIGIIRRLADGADAPRWYAGDYFGDSFAPEAAKATR